MRAIHFHTPAELSEGFLKNIRRNYNQGKYRQRSVNIQNALAQHQEGTKTTPNKQTKKTKGTWNAMWVGL